MKIITVIDLEGMPEGSVLQDCEAIEVDGVQCWHGLWCSMFGSYHMTVEQAHCEVWSEEKHDLLWTARKWLQSAEGKEWMKNNPLLK